MSDIHIANLCSPWIKSKNIVWEKVLPLGKKCFYKKGNIVTGNGELVDCLYYLYEGRLKLSRINAVGTEKILWYLDKGNLFGEVPFWDRKPMDTTFTASENCEIYKFSRQCVEEEILVRHPTLVFTILESIANKARIFSTQASDITSLISRVSKVLIYVIDRDHNNNKSGRIECKRGISQQELASILGVHRVTLNHAVAQLKRDGVIESMGKNTLIIHDYESLLQLVTSN